jgi:RecA/RadA recombinase
MCSGLCTVGSVLQWPLKKLLAIKGLGESKVRKGCWSGGVCLRSVGVIRAPRAAWVLWQVDKIRESARKLCVGSAFSTAQAVLQRRRAVIRITTGSKELDSILGGGIETGSLTEVFGEFRTGKTQLIHTMCVTCQLARESGGGAGKVIVVDTEGAFRPERVAEIASKRFGLDADEVLDNIRVARVFNVDDQVDSTLGVAALLADDDAPTRLVIVDSVTNLWRQDYSGRGELSERQQRLNSYLADLKRICEEFNVAVLLSNQVMANPDSSMVRDQHAVGRRGEEGVVVAG